MNRCEVFFSNGYSMKVGISQRAFIELVSTEDTLLDNRLILLENKDGSPIYINPLQIVSVTESFSKIEEKMVKINNELEEKERGVHNLEAIKNLAKDVGNME